MERKQGLDPVVKHIFIEMGLFFVAFLLVIILLCNSCSTEEPAQTTVPTRQTELPVETTTEPAPTQDTSPEGIFQAFLQEHGLTRGDYTEQMLELYEKYPETREFILNYPLEKDQPHTPDISWADRTQGVPLFLQFDSRWGYTEYGYAVGGISGCAPTCLSMVAFYLTGNTQYHPAYMMQFSKEDGHVGQNGGTQWTLFSRGAKNLGFKVEELPLDGNMLKKRLDKGIPVVLSLGPGDFTENGHYVVCVGLEGDMIRVNDPFSRANSEKLWSYEQLEGQIRNLWAISNP